MDEPSVRGNAHLKKWTHLYRATPAATLNFELGDFTLVRLGFTGKSGELFLGVEA